MIRLPLIADGLVTKDTLVYALLPSPASIMRRLSFWLSLCPSLFSACAYASDPWYQINLDNDWQDNLMANNSCYGHYLLPEFAQTSPETVISADYSELLNQGTSTLSGAVTIEQPEQRLFAEQVYLHRDGSDNQWTRADAYGQVQIEQPGIRLLAQAAHVNLIEDYFRATNSQFRAYDNHARGQAASIEGQRQQPTWLTKASYTTCQPGNNFWRIDSQHISLNQQTDVGKAYHSTLYIKDIPVFYSPYLAFPINSTRKSGFLIPSISTDSRSGTGFEIPYYFNLAPNYDATLRTGYMDKRNLHLKGEFRYLDNLFNEGLLEGQIDAEILPHDKEFGYYRRLSLSDDSYPSGDPRTAALADANSNTRMGFHIEQTAQLTDQWDSTLTYTYVSDDNWFEDLNTNLAPDDQRQLLRQLDLAYQGLNWDFYANLQGYNTLQPYELNVYDAPYRMLPQLKLTGDLPELFGNLNLFLDTEYVYFDHGGNVYNNQPLITGSRFHAEPIISLPQWRPFGYLTPSVRVFYNQYYLNLDDNSAALNKSNNPNIAVPIGQLDGGIFLERETRWLGQSYTQTLEPRLFYLYVPNVNQNELPNFDTQLNPYSFDQLFRANRFSGNDRIGDANQLSYALTSRFFDQQGGERLVGRIGQTAYFANRQVSTCDTDLDPSCRLSADQYADDQFSPLISEIIYNFSPNWSTTLDGQYDTERQLFPSYGLRFDYRPGKRQIISGAFRVNQNDNFDDFVTSDIAGYWQFSPRWAGLGRWSYDYNEGVSPDVFAGVEYSSCCWGIRIGGRHQVTVGASRSHDTAFYVEFVLKGLIGLGNNFAGELDGIIPGYEDYLMDSF